MTAPPPGTFWRGVLACAPIAIGVLPFAVVAAVSAAEAGLSPVETAALSIVVFAGAAQLTALELAKLDAPALLVIGAALIVNLRFVMYSAALAPHVRDRPGGARAAMAYLLTDQAFAVSLSTRCERPALRGAWFYAGAGATLWTSWQLGTWVGIAVGAGVPASWSLDFCVALAFIALVVPHLRTRPTIAAAAASVGVFLLARDLPYGLALLPAALAGIAAGTLSERSATGPLAPPDPIGDRS